MICNKDKNLISNNMYPVCRLEQSLWLCLS